MSAFHPDGRPPSPFMPWFIVVVFVLIGAAVVWGQGDNETDGLPIGFPELDGTISVWDLKDTLPAPRLTLEWTGHVQTWPPKAECVWVTVRVDSANLGFEPPTAWTKSDDWIKTVADSISVCYPMDGCEVVHVHEWVREDVWMGYQNLTFPEPVRSAEAICEECYRHVWQECRPPTPPKTRFEELKEKLK